MTHNPTRKQFFAKMFGLAAAVSVVPRLLAKPFGSRERERVDESPLARARGHAAPVTVRPETRAVARRVGTF